MEDKNVIVRITEESTILTRIKKKLFKILCDQHLQTDIHAKVRYTEAKHMIKGHVPLMIDNGTYKIMWNNEEMIVSHKDTVPLSISSSHSHHEELIIVGKTWKNLDNLLFHLSFSDKMKPKTIYLSIWSMKFEEWDEIGKRPSRSIESVFIPSKIKKELIGDVKTFIGDRQFYEDHGVTWKRNYLFSGPPGSGKTSTALAIANEIGFDISIIPFSCLTDSMLMTALQRISDKRIIILEDVDSLIQEKSDTLSLSGILNALDGIHTPNGLITIMTTNYPDRLGDSFMRPGRVDLHVSFSSPTVECVKDALTSYKVPITDELVDVIMKNCDSMAGIQYWLFKYSRTPEVLMEKITDLTELGKTKSKKPAWTDMFQ